MHESNVKIMHIIFAMVYIVWDLIYHTKYEFRVIFSLAQSLLQFLLHSPRLYWQVYVFFLFWFFFFSPFQLPVPTEVVSGLSVPRTDSIHFHPLVAMGNHQSEEALAGLTENAKFPVHKIPFFFHLYQIHSSFVEVYIKYAHTTLPRNCLKT